METILLIDDSKAVTYIVKKFLEKESYLVYVEQNARRGLDRLQRVDVDLIICDIMMPGMDGFQFAEIVKEDKKFKDIPLIFFTAKGDLSDEFHGYMTGAEYYITKPVKKQDMLDKIEKALGKQKMEDEPALPSKRDTYISGSKKSDAEFSNAPSFTEAISPADSGPVEGLTVSNLSSIVDIYGSMVEVMWAFSFDRLLSFDNLNIIEVAIDRTSLDYPCINHLAFSEDGIDLTNFKTQTSALDMHTINDAFTCLINNFFANIIDLAKNEELVVGTICLLGDDAGTLADLEALLQSDGHQIEILNYGLEAIDKVVEINPDITLVITQTFGETQQNFCQNIRQRVDADSPIVLICNSATPFVHKLAYGTGMDTVMTVPWSKLALLRMIKKALNGK